MPPARRATGRSATTTPRSAASSRSNARSSQSSRSRRGDDPTIPGAGARGAGGTGRTRATGPRASQAERRAPAPAARPRTSTRTASRTAPRSTPRTTQRAANQRPAPAARTRPAPRPAPRTQTRAQARNESSSLYLRGLVGGARDRRAARAAERRTARARSARRPLALRVRLGLPYFVVVLLAAALAVRVLWVGVINSDTYAELGRSKRLRTITIPEQRGSIFDRNGEALVMSVPTKLVAVDPTILPEPDELATRIAEVLGMDRIEVLNALERPDTRYSVVARQVDPEVAERLTELDIPGLALADDPKRVSVNGDLARSVTGSMDKYATEARSGIEKLYDEQLSAKPGEEHVEQGLGGSTIPGSERLVRAPKAGSNVTLTLDRAMQFLAEAELKQQVERVHAKGGTVVLGRPQTGEILAMASVARTPDGQVVQGSLNQAVRLYEPGSVMKLTTVSMAYDQGLVTPDSTMTVPPSITLYDRTVKDSHDHPTETMTVNEILSESSNVGTIMIAQKIEERGGKKMIVDYLKRFGFGRYTALGLPKEQSGVVKAPKDWNGTDIASIPIGQSVTVSPLQMWTAYNTIANDGVYVAPRLVRDVVDPDGRHTTPPIPKPRRVVSVSAANMVTRSLEDVVEEGTGKEFRIPGFNIAAKTGTAYKVQEDGTYGTAATRKYDASFVGFFPASNPQISIMVKIDEPAYGQHFGATAAGPVFDALARESMRRFSIAGDMERGPRTKLIRAQAATAPTTTTTTTTAPPVIDPVTGLPVPAAATPGAGAPATGTTGTTATPVPPASGAAGTATATAAPTKSPAPGAPGG